MLRQSELNSCFPAATDLANFHVRSYEAIILNIWNVFALLTANAQRAHQLMAVDVSPHTYPVSTLHNGLVECQLERTRLQRYFNLTLKLLFFHQILHYDCWSLLGYSFEPFQFLHEIYLQLNDWTMIDIWRKYEWDRQLLININIIGVCCKNRTYRSWKVECRMNKNCLGNWLEER